MSDAESEPQEPADTEEETTANAAEKATASAEEETTDGAEEETTASAEEETATETQGETTSDAGETHPDREQNPPADAERPAAKSAGDTANEGETADAEPDPTSESADDSTTSEPGDATDEVGAGVSAATLFEVLGNERRRSVIQVLRDREEPMSLADLSDAVAARENGVDPDDLSRRQRKCTYTALQQTHLPKMDDAGVLTFEKEAGEVTAGDAIVEYTLYLDVVPSMGVRRSEVYLGVALAGVVVTAGVWAGLPPFVWLGPLTWAALVVASVAIAAAVQLSQHPLFPERFGRFGRR